MKRLILIVIFVQIFCFPSGENQKRRLQSEKSNDIIILHTNDVHCGVNDTIGYDGLMLYKKQLLQKYNNVILVDAGDHIQGGTIGLITNGEAIIEIMNKLEYKVVTLGNHEFDYGLSQLETIEKLLNSSYISCNYCLRDKKPIYNPYKIIEVGDKKIGFIGVATPQTLSKTYLYTLRDDKGELIYDFLTENHSQELYDRIQEHIDKLKNDEKVDYIIILGHLGIGGDALEENTSAGVIKNLKNVNAFIDGHSHLLYSMTTPDKDGKPVILAQTGTKLANIGILTIHKNGTLSHKNINEVPYDPNLADETIAVNRSKVLRYVDKEMNEYIYDLYSQFSDELNRVIGKSDFLLNVFKNASESTDGNTQLSRRNENAFCNLVTDALRAYGEADITIMNAGAVRTDIDEGNITYQEVINTMPFSNDVIVKKIKGIDILNALEFGVRLLPSTTSRFPQVSGITYKLDTSINSSVVVDENEVFQKVDGERKVYGVKVNGKNLDVNKSYTISSSSFILGGGDGYSMFPNFETVKTSVGVDNEVLLKYIQTNLSGIVPEKYKLKEGRLIQTEGKIKNEDIHISLFKFYNYTLIKDKIKFNLYLPSLESIKFKYPEQIILPSTITYNSALRSLPESDIDIPCSLENEEKGTYSCEKSIDTSKINTVKINDIRNDNFDIKIGPLAAEYINNISGLINSTDNYNPEKWEQITMNDATIIANNRNSFTINGIINNTKQISFINKEVTLMAKQRPNDKTVELTCTLTNKTANNFNLICAKDNSITYIMDSATIIVDNQILLVDFKDGADSTVSYATSSGGRVYARNKSSKGGLSGGIIALIVVVPVVALGILAAMIFMLRKPVVPQNAIASAGSTANIIKETS